MPEYFLGVDPDLDTCAFAVVGTDDRPVALWTVRSEVRATGEGAVLGMVSALNTTGIDPKVIVAAAVEAQQILPNTRARPMDILHLGQVAGACLLRVHEASPSMVLYFPRPVQWKGSMAKAVKQRHILQAAGVPDDRIENVGGADGYCYPTAGICPLVTPWPSPGEWKHLGDALGLAQWTREQYQKARDREWALRKNGK